ncbi:MAG: hypothetical protein K2F87_00120 [Muribaculaceae bacterium]|nr:hypothetical protein [Muribaculaceae bacterium]
MAKKITAEVQLGFVYSPLTISGGIEVVGNVPPEQQFDVATGLYTPDYTGTYLVLRPWIDVADPDGVLTEAEKVLTNITWYVIENGAESLVTGGTNYGIATDGTLTVKRNINPDYPATFRFEADFLDTRTGEVYPMVKTRQVMAESVSVPPQLVLDAPACISYDPLRDTVSTRKIKARLLIGAADVAVANREFVWQKRDKADSSFAAVDGSDPMDYDVSVSADGSELTVDCSLIGTRIDLRVYAKYNPFGSPSGMGIDSTTPVAEVSVVRREGKLWATILSPRNFDPTLKNLKPECVVYDSKGEVPSPDTKCDIEWRTSKGVAAGTVSKSAVIATGSKPVIPTSNVVRRYGGKLIAEVGVKEPLRAATTADGKILTYNGKILLVR